MPLFGDLTQTGISLGSTLGSATGSILSVAKGTSYGYADSLVSTIPGFGAYLLMFALLLIIYGIYDLREGGFLKWVKWLLIFGALSYVLTGNPASGVLIGLFAIVIIKIIKLLFSGLFNASSNLLKDTINGLGKNLELTKRSEQNIQSAEAEESQNISAIQNEESNLSNLIKALQAEMAKQPRTPEVIARTNELATAVNEEVQKLAQTIDKEENESQRLMPVISGFLGNLTKEENSLAKFKPSNEGSNRIIFSIRDAIKKTKEATNQNYTLIRNYYQEVSRLKELFSSFKVTSPSSLNDLLSLLPSLQIFNEGRALKIEENMKGHIGNYRKFSEQKKQELQVSEAQAAQQDFARKAA